MKSLPLQYFSLYFSSCFIGFNEVPVSTTALLNSEVVSFTCASAPQFQAFNIVWLINGQPLYFEIMPPGVTVRNEIEETGSMSSALTLPTSLLYDNALVVCTLISEGGTAVSDPALLVLQCKHSSCDGEDARTVTYHLNSFIQMQHWNLRWKTILSVNLH